MNLPGFTAEGSLYEPVANYGSNGGMHFQGGARGSIAAALQNTATTREICRACGCIPSFFSCDCGNSKFKLACIEKGGPGKVSSTAGIDALRRL